MLNRPQFFHDDIDNIGIISDWGSDYRNDSVRKYDYLSLTVFRILDPKHCNDGKFDEVLQYCIYAHSGSGILSLSYYY